jgi:hypothetical protein
MNLLLFQNSNAALRSPVGTDGQRQQPLTLSLITPAKKLKINSFSIRNTLKLSDIYSMPN